MPSITNLNVANYQAFNTFAQSGVSKGSRAMITIGADGAQAIAKSNVSDFFGIGRSQDTKKANDAVRTMFRKMVLDIFGGSEADIPKSVLDAMKLKDYGKGKPLTARRIRAVMTEIDKANWGMSVKSAAERLVSDTIMDGAGLEPFQDPISELSARSSKIANDETATFIAESIAKHLKVPGEPGKPPTVDFSRPNSTFDKDVVRNSPISTFVGDKCVELSNESGAKARDGLTQFVTGDDKATFAGASDQVKAKVHILMACLNQGASAGLIFGVGRSFDPAGQMQKLMVSANDSNAVQGKQTQAFTLTKTDTGDIVVGYTLKYTNPVVTSLNTKGVNVVYGGRGSFAQLGMTLTLKAADMDRMAQQDWAAYDPTGKTAGTMPAQYKMDTDAKTAFSLSMKEGYTDPDLTQKIA